MFQAGAGGEGVVAPSGRKVSAASLFSLSIWNSEPRETVHFLTTITMQLFEHYATLMVHPS